MKTPKNYDLFWETDKPLAPAPAKADEATMPSCESSRQIDRPSNVRYDLMSNMVRALQYAYTPRLDEPPAGVRELPEVGHCYTPSWVHTRTTGNGSGVIRHYGKLRLQMHSRFRLNSSAAWQNPRTADHTWPDEQFYQVYCEFFSCNSQTTPEQGEHGGAAAPGVHPVGSAQRPRLGRRVVREPVRAVPDSGEHADRRQDR
ncbi:hypothetical protein ACIA47_04530 [Micromonospora sp. NPDC051227]|uniref:hypothetical protein n=1 Tax=Micromonospora sp. NPDC051227 TaxID=3364285 RepID=UPI00379BC0FF